MTEEMRSLYPYRLCIDMCSSTHEFTGRTYEAVALNIKLMQPDGTLSFITLCGGRLTIMNEICLAVLIEKE